MKAHHQTKGSQHLMTLSSKFQKLSLPYHVTLEHRCTFPLSIHVTPRLTTRQPHFTTHPYNSVFQSSGYSFYFTFQSHVHINSVPRFGAFAKLRKASISFVTSVCPSVPIEQLGCHRTDFYEILYSRIF
jgi:hypothetical protein